MPISRHFKRLTVVAACACAVAGASQIPSSSADLSSQIAANKSAAASLQSQINTETAQIQQTSNGVALAEQRLAMINARLDQSIATLRTVQTNLMEAREQLLRLEDRMALASRVLAANLRTQYENGSPNLVDVILNANGFSSLLSQVSYMKTVQNQDKAILAWTKAARVREMREATHLGLLEERDGKLTQQIVDQRNTANAIQVALLQQQIKEESARAGTRSKLSKVNSEIQEQQHELNVEEAEAAAKARESAEQVNVDVGGLAINPGGAVQPPPGAPEAVVRMIAAGNAIATLPYIWGGGHASFQSPGYDCSGSVSYVLAAAGLLSSPETSGEFESYGDPGPGQWVTIYANAGHVWMTIAGWRFDTVALAEDGTRWSRGGGEYDGFVVRHPVGL